MSRRKLSRVSGMIPMELLVSVCMIGALMLIVTIFIDKTQVLKRSRDLLRENQVQRLLSAFLQYQIDHKGAYPAKIEGSAQRAQMIAMPGQVCTDVCENQAVTQDCLDLSALVPAYLPTIPQDPFFTQLGPSGYYIYTHSKNGGITIGSCISEAQAVIETTR